MRIEGSSFDPSSASSSSSSASFASPFDSSSNSPLANDQMTRCEGLDLLVKAIHHISGAVLFDFPSVKRKVVRRGRRAFGLKKAVLSEIGKEEAEKKTVMEKKDVGIEVFAKPERRKRLLALPSKYQDSVLQPWKRETRRRRSIETEGGRSGIHGDVSSIDGLARG